MERGLRKIQDCKLDGDMVADIVFEYPIPDGATMETAVMDRMSGHYVQKSAIMCVRVIDSEGIELFRWTWWDECGRRAKETAAKVRTLAKEELRKRGQ